MKEHASVGSDTEAMAFAREAEGGIEFHWSIDESWTWMDNLQGVIEKAILRKLNPIECSVAQLGCSRTNQK